MKSGARFALMVALIVDGFLWHEVVSGAPATHPELHFLDVGQGDAQLLILPGGVTVLTDAGSDQAVIGALERALPAGSRYIDLAIITHPQLDHFGGMNDLLRRYSFGAVLMNGRAAEGGSAPQWEALLAGVTDRRIPLVVLTSGDRIRHGSATIDILNPDEITVQSGELNDTGIVQLIRTVDMRALLTADIGFAVEERLLRAYDLGADILKVPHHGSKFSSGSSFLSEVQALAAFIGVGNGNRYGHPTEEALSRLSQSGAQVLRTDEHGSLRVVAREGALRVFGER